MSYKSKNPKGLSGSTPDSNESPAIYWIYSTGHQLLVPDLENNVFPHNISYLPAEHFIAPADELLWSNGVPKHAPIISEHEGLPHQLVTVLKSFQELSNELVRALGYMSGDYADAPVSRDVYRFSPEFGLLQILVSEEESSSEHASSTSIPRWEDIVEYENVGTKTPNNESNIYPMHMRFLIPQRELNDIILAFPLAYQSALLQVLRIQAQYQAEYYIRTFQLGKGLASVRYTYKGALASWMSGYCVFQSRYDDHEISRVITVFDDEEAALKFLDHPKLRNSHFIASYSRNVLNPKHKVFFVISWEMYFWAQIFDGLEMPSYPIGYFESLFKQVRNELILLGSHLDNAQLGQYD